MNHQVRQIRKVLLMTVMWLGVALVLGACAGPQPAPTAAPPPAATSAPAQPQATTAPAQPTTASQPTAKSGGTLRVGLDVDAGTGDPRLARDTSAFRLKELVFNGLVYVKPDYTPAPQLAESWENPDPQTWIFKLRKGVKFHNGQELKAEDVKYTFDTELDEKFAAPNRSFYTPIKKVDVVDDYTVKFTLDSAYGPFLTYMDLAILPKAVAEKQGDQFGNSPVGTGPFKFVSWKRGDTIELEAFNDYFEGRPKLDKVLLKIVPDNSARVVALESGDLDLVLSPLSPQDVTRMQGKAGFKVNRMPAAGYTYISLNTADPALSDVKVRQALSYLVNREQILSSIYKGIGQVAKGPIPPGMWAYSADLPSYDYDPTKAKSLLDDAGWKAGADGMRSKDGKPLKLTLRTHTEDPDRRQVIEVLQAEFTKAGIQADTNVIDFATMLNDMTAGKYQVAVIGWLNLANPDRAMFRQFTIGGAGNYGKYNNPDVDKLIKDARTTLDQAKAKDLYQTATRQIVQDAPYIFLQYQEYITIHKANLNGFVMNPVQYFYSLKDVSLGQ
ncbi:MAG TPA: ABC transporter substrate-binding protein [Anaerolineae bacterium]